MRPVCLLNRTKKIYANLTDFILSAIPYLKKFVFAAYFVYNQRNREFIA